ncbi:hypothetical protein OUZ56_001521 [Daphnia magna]|uniref:Uncharacterized protein n=1 Tax=Daphnia magna TaxID=35525 RepID=A0ABR0A2X4_9CRUS|nr:hypothetical protein OUZ56_001521 [Daphnia magna]
MKKRKCQPFANKQTRIATSHVLTLLRTAITGQYKTPQMIENISFRGHVRSAETADTHIRISLELRDLYAGAFLVANGGQEKAVYSLSVATALSFTSC